MVKKFKRITYERDNDDHYIVVLNPWANGSERPRMQIQIDWIGAWLRIAFRKPTEKNIVKNIYTMHTRDEIIVRICSSVDIESGLGLHRWIDTMGHEHIEKIYNQSGGRIDLSDSVSHIFMYNWSLNGDPAERQWREWFPRQDDIPPNIMLQWDYPYPLWSEIPPVDVNSKKLMLPMPRREDSYDRELSADGDPDAEDAEYDEEDYGARDETEESPEGHPTGAFSPYEPPVHLRPRQRAENRSKEKRTPHSRSGKIDKLDPYEEDEEARANLRPSSIKQEIADDKSRVIKGDPEERKPDIRNAGTVPPSVDVSYKPDASFTEYRPSNALSSAISKLRDGGGLPGEGDRKPSINGSGQSSSSLFKQVNSDLNNCTVIKAETEDVKQDLRHDDEYRPSTSLVSAISRLNSENGSSEAEDRKPVVKNEEYAPTNALVDAFTLFSESASSRRAGTTGESKRSLEDARDKRPDGTDRVAHPPYLDRTVLTTRDNFRSRTKEHEEGKDKDGGDV